MRDGLRFGLLGPPVLYGAGGADDTEVAGNTARFGGGVRSVGSGKMRALFVALLLEPGRVVSVDTLKDVLWDAAPPPSAQASLQNHVTRLRRLLDDPERLRAVPPGYLLRVDEGELDVRVFESHARAARAAHAERDWSRTVRESTAALALWRGTPLGGLPVEEFRARAFVQRLEEARLLLLERRYDAELHLAADRAKPGSTAHDRAAHGRAAHGRAEPGGAEAEPAGAHALGALAPELAALVAEHPLREAFHRLLMLVLHRTGRQAEALAVHRDLRARLLDELGVEPGPAVREAHAEILREPAAHAQGPSPEAADADAPPRPAQLPPPPAHFTGRREALAELRRALDTGPYEATRAPTPLGARGTARQATTHPHPPTHGAPRVSRRPASPTAVISGMAGVGKSALALHLAHELAEHFPDGQLYINLHGATPGMTPLTPAQALAALLRDLGTAPRRIPEHPDAAAALLRSTLAPARTLMVLDDAATAAQVRPLLPAGPGCAVIVTSRSPLTALDGAHRFPLAPLSDDESAALLRAASGRAAGLDAAHPLVELTGRLPLALRVVAARLAARRALTPDALAGQLAATEGRLQHLEYDDLSVRRSLAVAHEALRASDREADRDAAHALRHIGALDLPAYGAPLLARLTGTDEFRAEAALDRLVDVALLEETTYGRYVPHDLVRHFARELADSATATETAAAVEQALRWYTGRARQSLLVMLPPGYERDERLRTRTAPATVAAPPGAEPPTEPPFTSAEEAFAWGDRELPAIVALVERCARDHGDGGPAGTGGRAAKVGAGGEVGAVGDGGPADTGSAAALVPTLVRHLFPYLHRGGRLAELDVLGRHALNVARSLGDDEAEAFALTDRAGLHFMSGRASEALALNDEGLKLWRRLGVVSCVRRCLNNRGLVLESLGRYEESEETLRQSLELSRQLGDPYGEAVTFSHLGNLYKHTDARAAIAHHERSLALGEIADSLVVRHTAHCNIGYAHLRLGEPAAAVRNFEQSLRILGDDEDWQGESKSRLGLVRALRELGRPDRAAQECDILLDLAERRADQYAVGLARHQRGLLLRADGHEEEAYHEWEQAQEILDDTDSTVATDLRELLKNRAPNGGAAAS
ncbi:AfsR/SARP family transcriptional regulator [Streptomyces sp. SP18BB07]|uniref:AfsR/SARP family transcriptional regulator n=1 Tax=Streptomyces sp. SP18BB07 TaxID=3002522 RepID=UPI002E772C29|nr:BTAD domain-containing putative transcriptional regulator [Streptomyces sp. SP18BB07]MEE1763509.1 BTAD domain-containing putative transcriptional regulator [Streptomyces sp. SP18BB07]